MRIVTVDASGNETEANVNELNETLCVHELYESRCQVCSGAEPMNASVSADKPKRARHRVATKTTVTKTVEKELTFTEVDLRRMLRIPEGATLEVSETFEPLQIIARWTVTK